jgi:protein-S-isoprenylcysteine O-methyltransferase Ste14
MSNLLARIKRLFRLRFAVLYPLGAYLVFFTTPDDRSTLAGVSVMAAGMFMRLWSNGYAIKLDKLTTSGPYAFVRNPLYLGTALILLGLVLMLKVFLIGLIFFALIVAAYIRTIRNEEKMLSDKFGAAYLDYRAKVPAMWPTFCPYAAGEKWPFSFERLWYSREHKVVIWMSIIVIAFHLKEEFMVEGEKADVKILVLIIAACLLGLLDVTGEYVRSRRKEGRA